MDIIISPHYCLRGRQFQRFMIDHPGETHVFSAVEWAWLKEFSPLRDSKPNEEEYPDIWGKNRKRFMVATRSWRKYMNEKLSSGMGEAIDTPEHQKQNFIHNGNAGKVVQADRDSHEEVDHYDDFEEYVGTRGVDFDEDCNGEDIDYPDSEEE
ncbi:hypothetical protein F53441_13617 [Fusarium austroafricanum]|uniref:Uncharacterized protein n=1 Tax=Fusarium austroafricanum TaxID=2364996 RepID=A0A8H4NJ55_9HYPO|nr:hypothetical protein F53441_13617 [Fusarium austroafricanum]